MSMLPTIVPGALTRAGNLPARQCGEWGFKPEPVRTGLSWMSGGLAGASVGSMVAPGPGTAIGAIIGAVLGGVFGSIETPSGETMWHEGWTAAQKGLTYGIHAGLKGIGAVGGEPKYQLPSRALGLTGRQSTLAGIAGLALDIGTDPVTWAFWGAGKIYKVRQLAKWTRDLIANGWTKERMMAESIGYATTASKLAWARQVVDKSKNPQLIIAYNRAYNLMRRGYPGVIFNILDPTFGKLGMKVAPKLGMRRIESMMMRVSKNLEKAAAKAPSGVAPALGKGIPTSIVPFGARAAGGGGRGGGIPQGGRVGQQAVPRQGEVAERMLDWRLAGGVPEQGMNLPTSPSVLNKKTWYHGGAKGMTLESLNVEGMANPASLLGQGLYLTDNPALAAKYAKGGLYATKANVKKVLNAELPPPARLTDALEKALEGLEPDSRVKVYGGTFADARKEGRSLISAFGDLQDNLRNQMANMEIGRIDAEDVMATLASTIAGEGYDALTHLGGIRAGGGKLKHQVLVLLNPKQGLSSFAPTTPIPPAEKLPTLTHLSKEIAVSLKVPPMAGHKTLMKIAAEQDINFDTLTGGDVTKIRDEVKRLADIRKVMEPVAPEAPVELAGAEGRDAVKAAFERVNTGVPWMYEGHKAVEQMAKELGITVKGGRLRDIPKADAEKLINEINAQGEEVYKEMTEDAARLNDAGVKSPDDYARVQEIARTLPPKKDIGFFDFKGFRPGVANRLADYGGTGVVLEYAAEDQQHLLNELTLALSKELGKEYEHSVTGKWIRGTGLGMMRKVGGTVMGVPPRFSPETLHSILSMSDVAEANISKPPVEFVSAALKGAMGEVDKIDAEIARLNGEITAAKKSEVSHDSETAVKVLTQQKNRWLKVRRTLTKHTIPELTKAASSPALAAQTVKQFKDITKAYGGRIYDIAFRETGMKKKAIYSPWLPIPDYAIQSGVVSEDPLSRTIVFGPEMPRTGQFFPREHNIRHATARYFGGLAKAGAMRRWLPLFDRTDKAVKLRLKWAAKLPPGEEFSPRKLRLLLQKKSYQEALEYAGGHAELVKFRGAPNAPIVAARHFMHLIGARNLEQILANESFKEVADKLLKGVLSGKDINLSKMESVLMGMDMSLIMASPSLWFAKQPAQRKFGGFAFFGVVDTVKATILMKSKEHVRVAAQFAYELGVLPRKGTAGFEEIKESLGAILESPVVLGKAVGDSDFRNVTEIAMDGLVHFGVNWDRAFGVVESGGQLLKTKDLFKNIKRIRKYPQGWLAPGVRREITEHIEAGDWTNAGGQIIKQADIGVNVDYRKGVGRPLALTQNMTRRLLGRFSAFGAWHVGELFPRMMRGHRRALLKYLLAWSLATVALDRIGGQVASWWGFGLFPEGVGPMPSLGYALYKWITGQGKRLQGDPYAGRDIAASQRELERRFLIWKYGNYRKWFDLLTAPARDFRVYNSGGKQIGQGVTPTLLRFLGAGPKAQAKAPAAPVNRLKRPAAAYGGRDYSQFFRH